MKYLTTRNRRRLVSCILVLIALSVGASAVLVRRANAARATASAARPLVIGTCDTGMNIDVEATGGTLQTGYATLAAAFAAINTGVHQGVINVEVCGNTTESTTAELTASGVTGAVYTAVNIYPVGGARTITGSIVGAVIKLNGADNVTIDGRIGGVGTNRDLTVSNTNTSTATAAVWLSSLGPGLGAMNNVVRNLELKTGIDPTSSSNITMGIIMSGTTISTTSNGDDNDNNQFIFNRITKARYGIVTRGVTTNNNLNPIVTDNIIGPSAFGTDQITKTGILMQADTGATVSRNTVQFVGCLEPQACTGTDRVGIGIGSESWSSTDATTITSMGYTVTKNIIHDIAEENTFSTIGIKLGTTQSGGATNNLVANNFVYNIRANGTAGDQLCGIGISGGNGDSVVNNSISITGDMDPGISGSSSNYGNAIRIPGANAANNANFIIRNNSIYLDVNSNTATVHFYAITLNSAAYVFGTGGLNFNNYYINPANAQLFTGGLSTTSGAATTTEFLTLLLWQAALTSPQDAMSIQANPLYASITTDPHLTGTSPNINFGTTIAAVTDDIDNEVRPNGAAYDIGADEFYPLPGKLQLSSATYGGNEGTTLMTTVNRVMGSSGAVGATATLTDGTATGGAACGVGVDYVNPGPQLLSFPDSVTSQPLNVMLCTDAVTDPSEIFTITLSLPTGGASLGSPTVATATITDVPPPFAGSYNVGTAQTYTSLTNAGGIFEAMNLAGATGPVTINITSDLTGETGAVALNPITGSPTVLIKPSGAPRTISGIAAIAVIRINGADNIRLDGSTAAMLFDGVKGDGDADSVVGGTPALRELTVQNLNTTAGAGAVIALHSNTDGAQNNTIQNVNVLGNDPTQTLVGISMGGASIGTVGTDNDGDRVINCSVKRAFFGIYSAGLSAANQNTGTVIRENDLSATTVDRIRRVGILVFNDDGVQIVENSVGGIETNESADAIGIGVGTQGIDSTTVVSGAVTNANVARNKISGVNSASTVGFSAAGITVAGGTTGPNTISNNMITGVTSPATSPDILTGVFVVGVVGSNTRLYYNSVSMTGNRDPLVAGQMPGYCIAITGTDPTVELKNNIFYTTQTASGGGVNAKSYAIGMVTTTFVNLDSNFSDFWSTGANDGGFRSGSLGAAAGLDYADIIAWRTAVSDDLNSLEVDPTYVDPLTNLHLMAGSPMIEMATTLASVTNDFDGDTRPSGAASDIGADEIDVVAPDTMINSNPPNPTNSASATFTFSGTDPLTAPEAVASFECKLDMGMFAACTSPQMYSMLANGMHTFMVRAIDGAGNIDPTPASFTWVVDTIAPDTQITMMPPDPSNSANASFSFSGTDAFAPETIASFECKLDAGVFAACTSPQAYMGLIDGSHTFMVRAIDTAGNVDATPASYTWMIATGPVGPVSVTATAGTTGPTAYPTVKGAFDAINAGTHQGAVTVSIVNSTTEGTTPATLNSSGAGSASYTSVLIRPVNDGISVSGNPATGFGVIQLKGADNVTIDGDNPNSVGTNRNLTVNNTNTTTDIAGSVIRIATATTVVTSADNITLRNMILNGNVTSGNAAAITSATGSSNSSFVIYAGGNGGTTATDAPTAITSVTTNTAPSGTTINGLTIDNNALNQAARAIVFVGAATTVSTGVTITNNTIGASGVLAGAPPYVAPATTVYTKGIFISGTNAATITGNTLQNILSYVATTMNGIELVSLIGAGGVTINSNTITGVVNNGTSVANGIALTASLSNPTVNGNTISNVQTVAGGTVAGIILNHSLTAGSAQRNKVTTVYSRGTGGFGAYGINVNSGIAWTIRNNMVSDVNAFLNNGSISTSFGPHGIRVVTGTGHLIQNNSVNLFGAFVGSSSLSMSSALTLINTASTGMEVRNNILVNTMTGAPVGTPVDCIYLPAGLLVGFNLTTNNNDYFSSLQLAQQGTTAVSGFTIADFDPTMTVGATNWRTYTNTLSAAGTNDNASIKTDPLFVSTTDLHLTAGSPARNVGAIIAAVTDDIDNQLRPGGNAFYDIGADEFDGTAPPINDMSATAFISPASGSTVATGVAFAPQASFTNVGTATQTSVPVRYRVLDAGMMVVCNVTGTIPSISFTQTVNVTFPTCTIASGGAYTIKATSELVGDTNSANNEISGTLNAVAPLSGSYNVGTGGAFTSLTNPGGIFEALNAAGATGNVVINITSDLSGENGTITLNELAGGLTVTIKPSGAARSITGSSTVGIIRLNGADGVTIDGSLAGGTPTGVGGTASLRNLTVQNTNVTATAGAVIIIQQGPNSANNNTVKNVNVSGQDPTQTLIGIHVGGNLPGTAPTINNNNVVVDNCSFQKSFIAIFDDGVSAASQATGSAITHNDMSATGANRLRRAGIFLFNQNGIQVTDNLIAGIVGDEAADAIGIIVGIQNVTTTAVTNGGISNALISRNKISVSSTNTVGFSAAGIAIAGDPAGPNTISNNMITGVSAPSTSPDLVAGIFVAGVVSSNTRLYHNSVSMTGDRGAVAGQIGSYGIAISGSNPTVELKNNVFYTTQTSGGGANAKSYAIGMQSTTFGALNSNFNDFFFSGANAAGFRTGSLDATGTDFATLALWTGATTQDAASFSVDPLYVDPLTDLHLQPTSTMINAATGGTGVTVDIDGDMRPFGPASDIGADEVTGTPGVLAFSSPTYSIGESGVMATITVSRTGGSSGTVGVSYATVAGGTATGGAACGGTVDYVNTSGMLSFPDTNTSQTFNIPICSDSFNEANETVNLMLSLPTGGATIGTQNTAVLTINDDDPVPTLSINDVSLPEGNSLTTSFTFNVTLSAASGQTVTVHYQTADGSATQPSDYTAIPDTTLTFMPGETSKPVTVLVNGDTMFEGNETFFVNLSMATNATILDNQGQGTIQNDDASPNSITINDVRYNEGNSGTRNAIFTATLTCPAGCPPGVTVHYSTANGTATAGLDYVAVLDTILTFTSPPPVSPEGGLQIITRTFNVVINGDTNKEPNETFFVNLSNPANSTITDAQGVGIINDEDRAYVADFDRDLKTDFSVFRPSEGIWYISQSTSGVTKYQQFGTNGDKIVPGDYDGDGVADLSIFRPSNGTWFIERSSDFALVQVAWGLASDLPVQADYDGDGKTDVAVFRPSTGVWYVRRSSDLTLQAVAFGANGDKVVPGDYNGDGRSDFAVFRAGTWYVEPNLAGMGLIEGVSEIPDGTLNIQPDPGASFTTTSWGVAGDIPVSGDFDGDGSVDIAVFRPSNGTWYILTSLTGATITQAWGQSGDVPVVGDYDADGISDIAVWRPSDGNYYFLKSNSPASLIPEVVVPGSQHWGQSGDKPVPAGYVPEQ